MQNLPVTFNAGGQAPQLSAEFAAQLAALHEQNFKDLGGQALRRIKVGAAGFQLIDGGSTTDIPFQQLVGVIVGVAPCNHAVWYEREFKPGQEPEQPDLVWKMPTPDTFPAALPEQFHKKVNRNGREAWAFTICRRVALALLRQDAQGQLMLELEKPCIMDLTSMSLWGKGLPAQNQYKLSGLQDVCRRYSGNGIVVTPMMFYTQILPDATAPRGVVSFRPQTDQQGNLVFLSAPEIQAVYECATNQATRDMLEVRERLDYQAGGGSAAAAPVAPAAPVNPAPAAPAAPVNPAPAASVAPTAPVNVAPAAPVNVAPAAPAAPVSSPLAAAQAVAAQPSPANVQNMLSEANAILNGAGAAPVTPAAPAAPVTPAAPAGGIAGSVTDLLSTLAN